MKLSPKKIQIPELTNILSSNNAGVPTGFPRQILPCHSSAQNTPMASLLPVSLMTTWTAPTIWSLSTSQTAFPDALPCSLHQSHCGPWLLLTHPRYSLSKFPVPAAQNPLPPEIPMACSSFLWVSAQMSPCNSKAFPTLPDKITPCLSLSLYPPYLFFSNSFITPSMFTLTYL